MSGKDGGKGGLKKQRGYEGRGGEDKIVEASMDVNIRRREVTGMRRVKKEKGGRGDKEWR